MILRAALSLVLAVCALPISLGASAADRDSASESFPYVLEAKIPMFSFEDPLKMQVKVFDRSRREIRDATVIFEITQAAGPPPMGHIKEMEYYAKITRGETTDPEVKHYIEYLSNMKLAPMRSLQIKATYDSTGYYTATQVVDKFPQGISVYVAEQGGPLRKTPYFYPHRTHCEYVDATNYELVKTFLHQLATLAKKGQWADTEQKLKFVHASVHGFHGHHFVTVTHHGEPPPRVDQEIMQLQQSVTAKSSKSVLESVGSVLAVLEKAEGYFATIEIKKAGAGVPTQGDQADSYEIQVRDNVNQKGITGALVIVDENYNLEATLTNPTIIPIQAPDDQGVYRGLYHAKMTFLPEGILAREVGGGRYRFASKGFGSGKSPKRIFVYYGFGYSPGIPAKFVTKEIDLPYPVMALHHEGVHMGSHHMGADMATDMGNDMASHMGGHMHPPELSAPARTLGSGPLK